MEMSYKHPRICAQTLCRNLVINICFKFVNVSLRFKRRNHQLFYNASEIINIENSLELIIDPFGKIEVNFSNPNRSLLISVMRKYGLDWNY